jgi:CheY-like chemotaxis protein
MRWEPSDLKTQHKTSVLVVDDREVSRRILKDFLENQGFVVLTAADGQECVRLALNKKPRVILLDMKIPVIDGWETARLLKSNAATKEIPIIATTAQALDGDRDNAIKAGCDDYLVKPLNHEVLLKSIKRYL